MPETYNTTAVKAGYQFVLSKILKSNAGVAYKPDQIFTLYLAPQSVVVSPRKPHQVTPLMFGAHVDSGIQFLQDLQIRLSTGQQAQLSSDADGNAAILTGRERTQALRRFLGSASARIQAGTHRLEFHSDPRLMHFIIIPATEEQRNEVGAISRVGGSEWSLAFVVLGEVADGVSLFGAIDSFFGGAVKEIKRATGAVALSLSLLKDSLNLLPNAFQTTIGSLIDQGRALLDEIDGVVAAGRNLASLPRDATKALVEFAEDVRISFGGNEIVGDDVRRVGDELDALWFAEEMAANSSSSAPGSEVVDNIGLTQAASDEDTATIVVGLEADEDSLADKVDNSGVLTPSLESAMSSYTGWLPYTVGPDKTVVEIAEEELGDASKWQDIASLNGLTGPYPKIGSVLKIPVIGGGYPFSWGDAEDLETYLKELELRLYYQDFKLRDLGHAGVDWDLNRDLTDVDTISGRANYAQRYRLVVFRTEQDSNPEFPGVGVFLGVGEKRLRDTVGLTHISARQQLLIDPRTEQVQTTKLEDTADGSLVEFNVQTVAITTDASIPVSLEV
jgi:hypothetical protein